MVLGFLAQGKASSYYRVSLSLKEQISAMLIFGVNLTLMFWIAVSIIKGFNAGQEYILRAGLLLFMLGGLVGGLLLIISGCIDRNIESVDALSWSWKAFREKGFMGLIYGLVLGLFFGLFDPQGIRITFNTLIYGFAYGLTGALTGWLSLGLIGALEEKTIQRKSFPNQGITLSLKNGIIWGVILGLSLGLIIMLVFGLSSVLTQGLIRGLESGLSKGLSRGWNSAVFNGTFWGTILGLSFGIVVALKKGLMTFVKHYFLRGILIFKGNIPFNFVKFLDYCSKLIFLQKVGGGYIFIHRMLLDYFADMYEEKYRK